MDKVKEGEGLQTDNVKNVEISCETTERQDGRIGVEVLVDGELTDQKKPGTAAFSFDPPEQVFLLVVEICATSQAEGILCPSDVEMSLVIFPDLGQPVGGLTLFLVDGSGSSAGGVRAVLTGGAAGAFGILGVGGWYARRRWLRKRS